MKKFEDILGMTQVELKRYLKDFMVSTGRYAIYDKDGYLFCEPLSEVIPVLVTAHMDTVHTEPVKEIHKHKIMRDGIELEKWISPQGIGGDDRCGIWMIMNIVKEKHPYVLFCEDEELGCVGSSEFSKTHICMELNTKIKYMIELDRRGKNDAVYYSCGNKEFTEWIEKETGYKKAWGSCSDISRLMPASEIAGVNFSCGYYDEHTKGESIIIEDMERTLNMVKALLGKEIPQAFEYVKSTQNDLSDWYKNMYRYYDYDDDDDDFYYPTNTKKKSSYNAKDVMEVSDTDITLKVYITTTNNSVTFVTSTAQTKPECWMRLFMNNKYLCFDDIEDYEYY